MSEGSLDEAMREDILELTEAILTLPRLHATGGQIDSQRTEHLRLRQAIPSLLGSGEAQAVHGGSLSRNEQYTL